MTLCERCDDSGYIAVNNRTLAYVCAGPVPDDARNVSEAHCDCDKGMEVYREEASSRAADRRRGAYPRYPRIAT